MKKKKFTERINALRRELIDAIIAELNNHEITRFEFPDDVDRSELTWQIFVDRKGEIHNGWVVEVSIFKTNDLAICIDNEYGTYTIYTSSNSYAQEISFLVDLYECLSYYLNEYNKKDYGNE